MIRVRKQHPALGLGSLEWAETGGNPAVLAFYRVTPEETILAVSNFSQEQQTITITEPARQPVRKLVHRSKSAGDQWQPETGAESV